METNHETAVIDVCLSEASANNKVRPMRWDVLVALYLTSITTTAICFGRSVDAKYDSIILTWIYWHFAFETALTFHCLYSRRWARRFSAIAVPLFLVVGVVANFLPNVKTTMASMTFLFSDGFSLVASLCLFFNNAMPQEFQAVPMAILPHFVGVIGRIALQPGLFFQNPPLDVPQLGAAWLWIGLSVIPQIWFGREAIRGNLNHVGEVRYDDTKNSKLFILFCKFGAPCVALSFSFLFGLLGAFATVEASDDELIVFAVSPWSDLIAAFFLPVSIAGTCWIIFLCKPRRQTKDEKVKA